MDYLKEYRSFINSHHLSEGVRMASAILLPVFVLGYFGHLEIGMTVALGALLLSVPDSPGPIHHRRNGLIATIIVVFGVALIVGLTASVNWLFFIIIAVCSFVFSMIGVYGTRASFIGIAALFTMVLQSEDYFKGWGIVFNALYLLAGGVWYFLLSQLLYSLRPYKLTQQALGEYIMTTADYLRAKAAFYAKDIDYDDVYRQLLARQIDTQEKQKLVAELIFKTRSIVKESTHTGRVLVMVFLDVADLFERAMSSHQEYKKLHGYFDESGILTEYHQLILSLADELDEIGIAMKSGRSSGYDKRIDDELLEEREHLQKLRLTALNPANIEGFINLRQILDTIGDIAARIRTLHHYTSYDSKLRRKKIQTADPEDYITHSGIDPKLIIDNLSFRSNIFRHSVRITAAALFAYIVAQFLPLGHGYWILLTVIVILKPAYSLTRQRNFERLTGTLIGAAVGIFILYLVNDKIILIVIMTLSMIGTYTFIRKRYLVSVIMTTLYVLLSIHLIDPRDFRAIFAERVIDTLVGSVIAWIFGYLLSPVWERELIGEFMSETLRDSIDYFKLTSRVFTGKESDKTEIRVARKNSWVSLANLSDAFTRMLSEPKTKQLNSPLIHQFVVANHMLVSHIATLSFHAETLDQEYVLTDYEPLVTASLFNLEKARQLINNEDTGINEPLQTTNGVNLLDQRVNDLMRARQEELKQGKMETPTRNKLSEFKTIADQFFFIYKISTDINKLSLKLKGIA